MINYNIDFDSTTDTKTIKGTWPASASEFTCVIEGEGEGGNSDGRLQLKIEGGQITKADIDMIGTWERGEFIKTLEVILRELKA